MGNYIKRHLRLSSQSDAATLVSMLNIEGVNDTFVLETDDLRYRVDAKSLLAVLYFISEHSDHIYIVNWSQDGVFPSQPTKVYCRIK